MEGRKRRLELALHDVMRERRKLKSFNYTII